MKTYKLREITKTIVDGKHGDCIPDEDSGYYFISCKDIHDGMIDYNNARQIEYNSFVEAFKRTALQASDILITNSGTIGRMAFVQKSDMVEKTAFQKSVAVVRPDTSIIDAKYLYYAIQNCIDRMAELSNGSAQKNLLLSTMREFDIAIHTDLPTQHRIASILSAYDDLIENNRRQIKLLEEAAQRLYREWFVELRFPGYENVEIVDGVPEGWQVVFLGDVIEFDPKVPLTKDRMKQSVPMAALSASSMVLDQSLIENTMSNSGSKFKNGDSLLARITPCLENGKTAFVDCLDCDEGAVGSTEFIVMRSKNLNPYMVYCIARSDCFRTEAINSMTGSDGRQRAQKDKLKALSYILPPKSLIDRFEQFAQPCFDKIRVLNRQNGFLVKARDKLLPKLMSGEMEE